MMSGSHSDPTEPVLRRRPRPFSRARHGRPRGCATSASAIFATGSTSSTAPVAIALRGMPSYSASEGSCAIARPPIP